MALRWVALLTLLTACAHPFGPPRAPADPRERRRAELGACAKGAYPAWLDDDAVTAAIDLDQREAQASASNEAFRGAAFTSQPPPATRAGPRTNAVLEQRRAFQESCEASKKRKP